jgi:hypothetical protein
MIHYCLLKCHDIERFYRETVHVCYQYCILYFTNFYDVNKKDYKKLSPSLLRYIVVFYIN